MNRELTSYQAGLAQMISEMQPTHWFSAHWHREKVNLERVNTDLQKLARQVDVVLLGKQCHRVSYAARRTEAIYFVEAPETATHVHGFWRVAPATTTKMDRVKQTIAHLWRMIVPSGTVCLLEYDTTGAAAIYAVKEQIGPEAADRMILSRQWLPAPQQAVLAAAGI